MFTFIIVHGKFPTSDPVHRAQRAELEVNFYPQIYYSWRVTFRHMGLNTGPFVEKWFPCSFMRVFVVDTIRIPYNLLL